MPGRSQLSSTLSSSELSDLYDAIGRYLNKSAGHDQLRSEITKIVQDVLSILDDRGYCISSRRHRRIRRSELNSIVDTVIRRRMKKLDKKIAKEEREKREEIWKRKQHVKEILDGLIDKNDMGEFGRRCSWKRFWPYWYPMPVRCGPPMEWYYAPFGYGGHRYFMPSYVWGIPKTVKEEERKKKLEKKRKELEKKWKEYHRDRRRFNVENLHIYY